MGRSYTVAEIADLLGLAFRGESDRLICKVSSWEKADESSLVFLEPGQKPSALAAGSSAGCVIAPPDSAPEGCRAIIFSTTSKLDFARAAALIAPRARAGGFRDSSAKVAAGAEVAPDCDLGPFAVVGAGARIGGGSILHAGVMIGEGCVVGEECILYPNVVLYPRSVVGNRVILHAGVVVGGDGFGFVSDGGARVKFPQVGDIVIEDDVEIGSNTTLDRGALGSTRIGAGTKIDNLVQIAHNVQIGKGVVIAAQTGISGSTVIEDYAVIGGQVGIGDHARIQSGVVIGSKAGILPHKIVRSGQTYWGVPVRPLKEYLRLSSYFSRLPEMKSEIGFLKEAVARLEEALRDKR